MIRPPAVAGSFYPGDPLKLAQQVDGLLAEEGAELRVRARACLAPHAGYMYSGRVAAAVYGRLEVPQRVIVIGPWHRPRGASLAIIAEGEWETPLGLVPIDGVLARKILRACPSLREDEEAHSAEHSIEVQLPFLQRAQPALAFVPIVTGLSQYAHLATLGLAIAEVVAAEKEPVLLVASSDLNHYEPDEITREKDCKAIVRMLMLDPHALFETVRKEEISMCGYGAAVVTLTALRELGAMRAELVRHATSGEVNGDLQEVVGYAGMIFS